MTGGREQTVQAKNALQRSHKIDNGQITGERVHLEEQGMATIIFKWIHV